MEAGGLRQRRAQPARWRDLGAFGPAMTRGSRRPVRNYVAINRADMDNDPAFS